MPKSLIIRHLREMSSKKELKNPVFIIGSVRSGTTILGDILSQHKDVAYWLEPKYIWRYGKARSKHDLRYAHEATPPVKKYIRKRFTDFTNTLGKKQFIEKTPSNVFRISFIREIFPNGRFVQIVRNGNDSALSAEKKWTTIPDRSAIKRRLTKNEIPWSELPFYTMASVRDVLGRGLFPSKGFIWGQHFEGIEAYRKEHSIIETCAKQWSEGMRVSIEEMRLIPDVQKFTLRYEDLSSELTKKVSDILSFLELDIDQKVLDYAAQKVFNTKTRTYTESDLEKMDKIKPIIEKEMKILGYL